MLCKCVVDKWNPATELIRSAAQALTWRLAAAILISRQATSKIEAMACTTQRKDRDLSNACNSHMLVTVP